MTADAFNNQMTFVTNYLLGSGSFNHFERLAAIIYTDNVIANATFGSFQTHDDLFNFINNIQQNVDVNTPKITPALNFASNYINATSTTVTILFTSSADPADISTANSSAQRLRTAGRFSVVTIGDQVFNTITTTNFADYVISWTSGSIPTNWETYFKVAFMCNPLPMTTMSPIPTAFSQTIPVFATTINPDIYSTYSTTLPPGSTVSIANGNLSTTFANNYSITPPNNIPTTPSPIIDCTPPLTNLTAIYCNLTSGNATIDNETVVSIAQDTKEALTPKTATGLDMFQVSVILDALAKVPSLSEEVFNK
uniref:VWFA domain-containing protein n=1 Tax=Acrobeloides nanus TaxID=290746 RepID=A0A914BV04_9BILA